MRLDPDSIISLFIYDLVKKSSWIDKILSDESPDATQNDWKSPSELQIPQNVFVQQKPKSWMQALEYIFWY